MKEFFISLLAFWCELWVLIGIQNVTCRSEALGKIPISNRQRQGIKVGIGRDLGMQSTFMKGGRLISWEHLLTCGTDRSSPQNFGAKNYKKSEKRKNMVK